MSGGRQVALVESSSAASVVAETDRVRPNPNHKLVLSGIFFYNSLTKSPRIESLPIYRNNLPELQFLDNIIGGASVKIVQSVNGLLLCSLISTRSRLYCVCNPTTAQYRILPQPQNAHQSSILGYNLVFDPSVSLDYKVICVRQSQQQWLIDVYSSENQSWSNSAHILQVPLLTSWGTSFKNGVFWNGGIHWDTYRCIIFRFDLSSGSLTSLPNVPIPSVDRKGGSSYFGESNGCLYHVKVPDICSTKFYVFELRVGDVAWACKYCVEVSDLVGEFREIRQRTKQRGYDEVVNAYSILHVGESFVAEEGEEDGLWMLLAVPGKVVSYSFASKKVKVVKELAGEVVEPFKYESFAAFGFMESLFHV